MVFPPGWDHKKYTRLKSCCACSDGVIVLGKLISRAEAIKIASDILEQAERERLIIAEAEASKGIQYE
jgi:hypothetical protein